MRTFSVCLTRDITESAVVEVEAQNEDEAFPEEDEGDQT